MIILSGFCIIAVVAIAGLVFAINSIKQFSELYR